jgi:hypothetical protein
VREEGEEGRCRRRPHHEEARGGWMCRRVGREVRQLGREVSGDGAGGRSGA